MRACRLSKKQRAKSISEARKNWKNWRGVFEHSGPISTNPLLARPDTFADFLSEYKVYRTIRKDKHDAFRRVLQKSPEFKAAIRADDGRKLDKIESKLRRDFGTRDAKRHPRRMISVFSKVAAFVRPERFVARDSYSMKGLNKVLKEISCQKDSSFNAYADYLDAFERVWKDWPGQDIKDYMKKPDPKHPVECQPRFQRRVLDAYLMIRGGRWEKKPVKFAALCPNPQPHLLPH